MDTPNDITYIGKTDFRNTFTKFGIKAKDRTKHMYIIGKTGTGKSTFLENMIIQDIQNGNGLAFIDPHGGSAEKLLDYIPEHRINDVIYFNPSDTDFPIAFNPLEDVGAHRRHLVADGLMSVFEKIWPEAFSGRATYILNNTMMALLESPDPTLLGINRMLTDKEFRKRIIANITDPSVRDAWSDLTKWDDKRWSEAVGTLINKVGQFTTNPIIRNIIGQPKSTFDFRKAMDDKKIIIINLSKGMIGEQNAPLIGAMLITKIYLAAMSRAELSSQEILEASPFYFYVDEFQNFANDSFASILSEARKYKLCLTVANQYIAQMEETIRDAVFGNMGTTVAFRVGPLDAEFVEKVFAPVFTAEDLQNIAFGQLYLTLQIDNMGSRPFSANSLPPMPPLTESLRRDVIDASRRQFTRPKSDVDQMVVEYFGYNNNQSEKSERPKTVASTSSPTDYHAPASEFQPPKVASPKPIVAKPTSKPILEKIIAKPTVKPVVKKSAPSAVPITKSESVELSSQMSDLLNKLGEAAEITDVSAVSAHAEQARTIEKTPESPKTIVTTSQPSIKVENPATVPVKKTKDRAAGSDSKNLLLEALHKAETLRKTETKIAAPVAADSAALGQAIAGALGTEPLPTPEPIIEKIAASAPTAPVLVADTFTTPHPIREVPEDILKKILE